MRGSRVHSISLMISHCSLEASSCGNGTKVKHANWIAAPLTSENEFIHERSQKNDGSSSLGGTSRSGNIAVGLKAPWHFISFMLSLQGTSGLRCLSTERTFMRVPYGGCSSNLSLNIRNSGIDVTVEQRTEQTESTQPWFSIRFSSMFPLHITSAKVLATFLHRN